MTFIVTVYSHATTLKTGAFYHDTAAEADAQMNRISTKGTHYCTVDTTFDGKCDCCGEGCDEADMAKVNGYHYCEGCMEDGEVMNGDGDPALNYC